MEVLKINENVSKGNARGENKIQKYPFRPLSLWPLIRLVTIWRSFYDTDNKL